jgi:predicted ATPase
MTINRIKLRDFLVFKGELTIDLCQGINVFIGGNGTGKTTLLRAMYAVQEHAGRLKNINHIADYLRGPCSLEGLADILNSIGRFLLFHSEDRFYGYVRTEELQQVVSDWTVTKGAEEGSITFIDVGGTTEDEFKSVYVPEKDLLSHSKKLPESVEYGGLEFTRCEIDLIKKARVAASKPSQPLYEKICALIKGEPQNDGQSFFMKRPNIETPIPFSMEASGHKKFGLLATLIRNEQIKNGTVLFWDEPENSLNPEIVPAFVEILLNLSRNGVQIFIATHDYNFARYFDVRKDKTVPVVFHNLTKVNEQIDCNSSPEYLKLPHNLLEKASADLFKAVVSDAMEVQDDE